MDQITFHKQLLDRYVNNIATTEELEVIDYLISTGELDEMLMEHMAESWKTEEAVFESDAEIPTPKQVRRFKLWPRIAVAAAAVAVITTGIYFFKAPRHPGGSEARRDFYANDIAPGKQGATLTLANGRQIRLTDATNGELAKEAGVVISKSANGELIYTLDADPSEVGMTKGAGMTNTLSTAKGETYQIVLPDKSKVWLNAVSSLTYAANLNVRGQRRVRLNGEGYFEVAKDKAHPFIVESKAQQVEVLGTHFNINGYTDENSIKTTLLAGSVKVSYLSSRAKVKDPGEVTLKPNQQSTVSGNSITVKDVEVSDAVAWKDGNFVFKAEPLTNVMRTIARWYDIAVVYADDAPKYVPLSGIISRSKNISVVLERMEATGSVKFKIEGRKVIVSK